DGDLVGDRRRLIRARNRRQYFVLLFWCRLGLGLLELAEARAGELLHTVGVGEVLTVLHLALLRAGGHIQRDLVTRADGRVRLRVGVDHVIGRNGGVRLLLRVVLEAGVLQLGNRIGADHVAHVRYLHIARVPAEHVDRDRD